MRNALGFRGQRAPVASGTVCQLEAASAHSARPGRRHVGGALPAGSGGCECQQCALRSDGAVRSPFPVSGTPSPSPLAPVISGPCCWQGCGLCTCLPETLGPLWRAPPRRKCRHLSSPPGCAHTSLPLFRLLPSWQGLDPCAQRLSCPWAFASTSCSRPWWTCLSVPGVAGLSTWPLGEIRALGSESPATRCLGAALSSRCFLSCSVSAGHFEPETQEL